MESDRKRELLAQNFQKVDYYFYKRAPSIPTAGRGHLWPKG